MLTITTISVTCGSQKILNSLSFAVEPGTLHVLMGPNGSGKSTLAHVLMGHPEYRVTKGSITFDGQDITQWSTDKRARLGIFLAFQNPCTIPGVTAITFLREAYCAKLGAPVGIDLFNTIVKDVCAVIGVDPLLLQRPLNEGFSGGEKKRLEMVQLLILQPKLAILDEIDSGLDVDALKLVAAGIEHARKEMPTMSIVLITHYQRILQYMKPDVVHVMRNGMLVACGGPELAQHVEQEGYAHVSIGSQIQVGNNGSR